MANPRRDRQAFAPYLRVLADQVALKDWEVEVSGDPLDGDEDLAMVRRVTGRKVADVQLAERFLDDDEPDQRHTLLHELIHLHLTVVDFFVEGKLSESDFAAYCMLREYAVDGLADGVSAGFPLPSEVLDAPTEES